MHAIGDDATLTRAIAANLSAQVGHPVQVGTIRRFPVGFSWLTYGAGRRPARHGRQDAQEGIAAAVERRKPAFRGG